MTATPASTSVPKTPTFFKSPRASRSAVQGCKTIAENRQARHQYHIEDTWEAGVELQGWEVKAALGGQATFNGGAAFVRFEQGQAFVENMTFTPLSTAGAAPAGPGASAWAPHREEPNRRRRLLLKRVELDKLAKKVLERGYTVVPLELTYKGKLKLNIGLAKGKQLHDKKDALKARDEQRELQRDLRQAAKRQG